MVQRNPSAALFTNRRSINIITSKGENFGLIRPKLREKTIKDLR